jgi:hypothetical protein
MSAKLMTVSEFLNQISEDRLFDIDDSGIDIHWYGNNCGYWITWEQVDTQAKLLTMIRHISKKGWKDMTPQRLGQLADAVCQHFGWPWAL